MQNLNLNIKKKALGPTLAKGGKTTVETDNPNPNSDIDICYGGSSRICAGGTYDPNTGNAGGAVTYKNDSCC
ncbi:hypothetical protein [Catenovulum sediminis]|uniref:Uncharacterized protein n=1 Tax=Catenovulum sediminis TaxID=1740262 RepID=A0ABV1RCF4_9ALTE|nr:hypothetical protein [Catenovulum sediminis]